MAELDRVQTKSTVHRLLVRPCQMNLLAIRKWQPMVEPSFSTSLGGPVSFTEAATGLDGDPDQSRVETLISETLNPGRLLFQIGSEPLAQGPL